MSREDARDPIRIIYLLDNENFDDDERSVLQLAGGLPRNRYELSVVYSDEGELVDRLHDLGVPVSPLDLRPRRRHDVVNDLAREFRRRRPHIVHGRGRMDVPGRLAARYTRVPALVSSPAIGSGSVEKIGLWRKFGIRLTAVPVDRMVDRFVVASRDAGRLLTERRRVPPDRVAVIPHGIPVERYEPRRIRRGGWRARYGVPEEVFLVGGMGRLAAAAGFGELIRAVAGVDRSDVWLAIAGDGPEWEELDAVIHAVDVRHRCLLPGSIDDVQEFLANLDLFVSAARSSGHVTALLEAMAMARPVIATDFAGAEETIADGVDGRLVGAGDISGLAETIRRFEADREAGARLGRNARSKIQREFSADRMVRRTSLLYEEVLSRKAGLK